MRAVLLTALLALTLAAPAETSTAAGLRGYAIIGPLTPVCREGQPCDGPAKRITLSFARAGRTTTTRTDLAGNYRLVLAAGTYTVHTGRGQDDPAREGARRPRPDAGRELRDRYGHPLSANRVLVYVEAVDVAAEGAVWYARRIGGGTFDGACTFPGKSTDTGHPRALVRPDRRRAAARRAAGRERRDQGRARGDRRAAQRDDEIVTVVLPEQFSKRSLHGGAQRAQFRLKLRLLVEPDVVVADVPAVTSERRPEGRVPEHLLCACWPTARRRDEARGRLRPEPR